MYCRTTKSIATRLLLAAGLVSLPFQSAARAQDVPTNEGAVGPKFLPVPEQIARPNELSLFNDLFRKAADAEDLPAMLPALDGALGKLREPTQSRGLVQYFRAGVLMAENRQAEAIDAIEESIRLLPGYSGPLLTAASIYAYANQPAKGTDYFLRASQVDPETVRQVEDYEVNNLIRRLTYARDRRHVSALSDRLLEIGWIGSSLASRSALARAAIERRLAEGNVAGAKALISKLLVPDHSYALLVDKQFSAVWPDVETWAGPKLQTQWATYLREARDRWTASKDVNTVRDYSNALIDAGHDRTVIREIVPLFYRKLDEDTDQELQFVVARVAGALAREGRWSEVERLFERAQQVWPLRANNPNALNVTANWARYLHLAGKHQLALDKIDAALIWARRWQVNPDAVAGMQHNRACILHELGRDSEAGFATGLAAAIELPDDVARLHICTGNYEAARRVLLEGLKSEDGRDAVLLFLQKSSARPVDSTLGRRMQANIDRLKADPTLLREIDKYGRRLPFSAQEGAPAEGG